MKNETRKCAVCGKKFTPKSANALYCSDKCYKIAKAKRSKARKAASKGSPKDAKKIAAKPVAKPVAKKPVKKVVKAVCKEKVALPKKPTCKVEVRKVSPEMAVVVSVAALMKCIRELFK